MGSEAVGSECVFCAIVAGQAQASLVHEDESVVVLMDLHPVTHGHLLVVPRGHVIDFNHLDPAIGTHVWAVGHDMARALRRSSLGCEGINVLVCDGEVASQSVKRVALELGGKSANVILDDADLKSAVGYGVSNCYLNSGQTCSAHTRMLVPREQLAEVEQIAAAAAEKAKPGDPFEDGTRLGPLVSDAQRERVRGFIKKGEEEGAKLVTGGAEPPEGLDTGYFVRPTVFSDVRSDMTIAQEEIFGPVLVIQPYDDEEDAIRIANDTQYGLAGGVWSGDEERAKAVARRIRTGQVEINGGVFNPLAPFGGYKQSGHGRELGRLGVEEFLAVKSLQL